MTITRRHLMAGTAGLAATGLLRGRSFAQGSRPASPVTLTVADVAGNLALTQGAMEAYAKARPDMVSRIAFTKAPAPELPAKLQAQQQAGRVDIDLVLTGTDALSAGLDLDLWTDLKPQAAKLPNLQDVLLPQAWKMQAIAKDHGVVVSYYPSGPLIEFMPDRTPTPPKTAQELLDWSKQNPNKLIYARPTNSGPGRTFLMGLPYILKDSDPRDPAKGWSKTWEYLKALGQNMEYYATGTAQTMREFGDGTRDIVVTTTGWDINPRVLGTVPQEAMVGTLDGFHWVTDAHYMVVPKGVSEEKLGVLLDLMNYMLQPEAQAYAYDQGYFYPGPAAKNVTLAMAPQESQDALAEFGRPDYDKWIADNPLETPLDAAQIVTAFRMWDEQIGAAKK
jgi:putative spermidine/putrescine transport system substrate-binding protein